MLQWQDLFSAALDPLQDCQREWNTVEVGVRDNIQILKARVSFCSSPSYKYCYVLSIAQYWVKCGEIYVFCMDNGYDTSNCTNLAVYSATNTDVRPPNWKRRTNLVFKLYRRNVSGSRDCAVARALASHQWVCCWFSPCSEGFSPGFPLFFPPQKPTSPNDRGPAWKPA